MQRKPTFGQRVSHVRVTDTAKPHFSRSDIPRIEQRAATRRARWCVSYVHCYAPNETAPCEVREAILLDISATGARVRSRSRAAYSKRIRIRVDRLGLNLSGRVIWQRGFDAGIEFD
ncbi:MAG: PilZ domain-containing protein [Henriciella sp.]|nr:PilZ domain-containing protein [Henriciella sp.]